MESAERAAPPRRRLAAAQRRDQLLRVASALARDEGVGALSLARVADAAGVSKPVVYEHFPTPVALLTALHARLDEEYERAVFAALEATHASGEALLRVLCEAYLGASLDNDALLESIGARIASLHAAAPAARLDLLDRFAQRIAPLFRLEDATAYPLTVAFIGAADRVCEVVVAGRLSADDAVEALVSLFAPALEWGGVRRS